MRGRSWNGTFTPSDSAAVPTEPTGRAFGPRPGSRSGHRVGDTDWIKPPRLSPPAPRQHSANAPQTLLQSSGLQSLNEVQLQALDDKKTCSRRRWTRIRHDCSAGSPASLGVLSDQRAHPWAAPPIRHASITSPQRLGHHRSGSLRFPSRPKLPPNPRPKPPAQTPGPTPLSSRHASSRTASDSNFLPSSIPRLAPPPVDTCENSSDSPNRSTAAAVSPPPTIVMAPRLV